MLSPNFIYTSLSKTSLKRFLKILILWVVTLLITLTILIVIGFNLDHLTIPAYKVFFQLIADNIKFFSLLIITGSLFLTPIHYLILRLCSRKPKTKIRIKEALLLSIIFLLSIGAATYAIHLKTMKNQLFAALVESEIEGELNKLLETKQYELLVQEIEASIANSRHIRKMLGSNYGYPYGKSGLSYMYTTCPMGWSHTSHYISHGLNHFLQSAEDWGHNQSTLNQYDYRQPNWQSLAKHMISSEEPILRCTGYWILKDKENFRISSYAATNSGDPSCNGFTLFAADTIDHDPIRSWQMATKVWKDIQGSPAVWDYSGRIIKLGIKAEEQGINLAENTENFRKHILIVHESILNDGYGYDARKLPKDHKKALLKHGFKKEHDDFYTRAQKIKNNR